MERRARAYRWCALCLRGLFAPACRCKVLHEQRAGEPGAWILAPNHISHFDPPLLSIVAARPIDWMAMEELFRGKIFGALLRRVGAFPVKRGSPDRAAIKTAIGRLRAGHVVGIFPEGGIRDGPASLLSQGELKPGLSLVAASAGVCVRPVVILGSDRLYAWQRWGKWKATTVWIGFGELLPPPRRDSRQRQEWESHFVEALRTLAREVAQTFALSEADWPRSPQQRMEEG